MKGVRRTPGGRAMSVGWVTRSVRSSPSVRVGGVAAGVAGGSGTRRMVPTGSGCIAGPTGAASLAMMATRGAVSALAMASVGMGAADVVSMVLDGAALRESASEVIHAAVAGAASAQASARAVRRAAVRRVSRRSSRRASRSAWLTGQKGTAALRVGSLVSDAVATSRARRRSAAMRSASWRRARASFQRVSCWRARASRVRSVNEPPARGAARSMRGSGVVCAASARALVSRR